jgi:hypothetical protein
MTDSRLTDTFRSAVLHLRDILAVRSKATYDACGPTWEKLTLSSVLLVPTLMLEGELPASGIVRFDAPAHVDSSDLPRFYFRTVEDIGSLDVGGAVMGSLFSEAPPDAAVDALWGYAWSQGQAGIASRGVQLAEPAEKGDEQPPALPTQPRGDQPHRERSRVSTPAPTPAVGHEPAPRQLKKFARVSVDQAEAGGDRSPGKVMPSSRRRPLQRAPESADQDNPASRTTGRRAYTDDEREHAGIDAFTEVMRVRGLEVSVHRRQHGVGADLRDRQGRFYELKVYGQEMPDEVNLEHSELERALKERDSYYLVIVSGVERGYETKIKIFDNPTRRLDIRASSHLSLSGIRSKLGQTFTLRSSE